MAWTAPPFSHKGVRPRAAAYVVAFDQVAYAPMIPTALYGALPCPDGHHCGEGWHGCTPSSAFAQCALTLGVRLPRPNAVVLKAYGVLKFVKVAATHKMETARVFAQKLGIDAVTGSGMFSEPEEAEALAEAVEAARKSEAAAGKRKQDSQASGSRGKGPRRQQQFAALPAMAPQFPLMQPFGPHLPAQQLYMPSQPAFPAMQAQASLGMQPQPYPLAGRNQRKPTSNALCHACGQPGHWARECPMGGAAGYGPRPAV